MLSKISLITSLLFASLYPLNFWIHSRDPLKDHFHRFHIGVANFICGVAVIFLLLTPLNIAVKTAAVFWLSAFFLIAKISWHEPFQSAPMISIPCFFGLLVTGFVFRSMISTDWTAFAMTVIGGSIFCLSLYAMNLGHWYLNIHGLPVSHLRNTVKIFWVLTGVRFILDLILIFTRTIIQQGEEVRLFQFMTTLDGFLLSIALLFGTLFPLIVLWFVKGTLDLKNTQSATGILYAILCAVVIGDMAYKYYLIQFGVAL